MREAERSTYVDLRLVAADPNTTIWVGDDAGHLVCQATGTVDTALLAGDYVVRFGLNARRHPLPLLSDTNVAENDFPLPRG